MASSAQVAMIEWVATTVPAPTWVISRVDVFREPAVSTYREPAYASYRGDP